MDTGTDSVDGGAGNDIVVLSDDDASSGDVVSGGWYRYTCAN